MLPPLRRTASSIAEGARFRSDEDGGSPDSEQDTLPSVAVGARGLLRFTEGPLKRDLLQVIIMANYSKPRKSPKPKVV